MAAWSSKKVKSHLPYELLEEQWSKGTNTDWLVGFIFKNTSPCIITLLITSMIVLTENTETNSSTSFFCASNSGWLIVSRVFSKRFQAFSRHSNNWLRCSKQEYYIKEILLTYWVYHHVLLREGKQMIKFSLQEAVGYLSWSYCFTYFNPKRVNLCCTSNIRLTKRGTGKEKLQLKSISIIS